MQLNLAVIDLEEVLANSYRDFHAKGFDYLCLRRSEKETVKVYFFEGDSAHSAKAVIPHDHRYDFLTRVLAGSVVNHEFSRTSPDLSWAIPYERFDYLTPLNGGDGFVWRESVHLRRLTSSEYWQGDFYRMRAPEVHTITVTADTVLMLTQYEDRIPLDAPTSAYKPIGHREAPSLDGLYRPMDADHALKRLAQVRDLLGPTARAA